MKRIFILVSFFVFVALASWEHKLSAQQVQAKSAGQHSRLFDVTRLLRDVETLSADAMEGRKVGTPGGAKAREYVLERFKQAGLKSFGDSYLQSFEVVSDGEQVRGMNVVGYIKGKSNSNRYVVVTAHYDHLGIRDNQLYNGADDNASGVSALFALATYFQQHRPANSMIFVAFDAEETGLSGSKKFVAETPVKKESIAININLDMISHNDRNELYLS
ncbi:MAG TPA: M28 family peptidase, partial [Pyrinomonadaceae bacterium]